MIQKLRDMAGIYFGFILGAALLGVPLYQQFARTRPLTSDNQRVFLIAKTKAESNTKSTYLSGNVQHISIDSLKLTLPVEQGYYNESLGTWTIDTKSVFHATNTPQPNNKEGNTLIYGHSEQALFGKLPGLEQGAEASVITDNGLTFIYTFEGSKQTTPTDVELFNYTGAPILTLQTCSGVWWEYRTLFVFSLKEVKT